jgi:hypothetical protein
MIDRRPRLGPLPRRFFDELQRDGRQAHLAMFGDRRLQVRHEHRRALAQCERD